MDFIVASFATACASGLGRVVVVEMGIATPCCDRGFSKMICLADVVVAV
jgi:hypothetical protein